MSYHEGIGVVGPDSTELQFLQPPWLQRKGATYIGKSAAYKHSNSLRHAIYTDSNFECPGLAIINKREGWHRLYHIFFQVGAVEIYRNLIGKASLDESDIYVLPGCSHNTQGVIGQLLLGLALIEPPLLNGVRFVHFPKADPWIRGARKFVSYGGGVGFFDKDLRWKSTRTSRIELADPPSTWCLENLIPTKAGGIHEEHLERILNENLADFTRNNS